MKKNNQSENQKHNCTCCDGSCQCGDQCQCPNNCDCDKNCKCGDNCQCKNHDSKSCDCGCGKDCKCKESCTCGKDCKCGDTCECCDGNCQCCKDDCKCCDGKCECEDKCSENCKCDDDSCQCNNKNKNAKTSNTTNLLKQEYEKQIKLADQKISELTLEIIKLKQELLKSQDEYKKRLEEKSEEANQKVAAKRKELEDRLNDEIEIKKSKLISNDMQQLFTTIDQFENVINSPTNDPQVNAYISGFKMLLSLFEQSLNNLGITRIIVKEGDKFNADIMSAVDAVESQDQPSGVVIKVQSPAYIYNEKVVKYAVVIVSK